MPATRRRSALSATFGTFVRGLQPTITFVAWIPCLRWGVPVRHLSTPEIDQPEIESGGREDHADRRQAPDTPPESQQHDQLLDESSPLTNENHLICFSM